MDKRLTLVGGIIVVGSAAGIWYYLSQKREPDAYINQATVQRSGNGAIVQATVTNKGRQPGYFKLQALIAPTDCPAGQSGRLKANDPVWANILNCIDNKNQGSWCGESVGGWTQIQPGQQATLQAPSYPGNYIAPGTYNLFVNAAVSTDGTSASRLFDREWYLFLPSVTI